MNPALDPEGADDPRSPPGDQAPPVDSNGVARPSVAGTGQGPGPWLGLLGVGVLGLGVFLWLSSHRAHAPNDVIAPTGPATAAVGPPPAPPPDVVAMETAARTPPSAPPPPPAAAPAPSPPPAPPAPRPLAPVEPQALHSPVLVVDLDEVPPPPAASGSPGAAKPGSGPNAGLNGDEQFAARVEAGGEPDRARASSLRNKSAVIAQGAMIPAVLETALDSDLPGFARAVVSRDVRSFDGEAVLIPRGSRVIGEYRTASSQGQSRAFVIWTRVLRPDGISVQIGSPATDPLGRAGLAGSVDHHFFERFGGAILLSVVNAGATALAGSPSTQVVIGSPQDATGVAAAVSAFAPANVTPTIKVAQGAPIRIFVARDLDFTPVGGADQ